MHPDWTKPFLFNYLLELVRDRWWLLIDGKSKKVELTSIDAEAFIVNEINANMYTDIQVTFKIRGKSISTIFSKDRKLERIPKEITKHYHEQSTEHSYK